MSITAPSNPSAGATSRRRFLKQAAGASTVFAVPNILTRPSFGAPSANGTIHVALIGCGNIGNYHRSNLAQIEDVRIIAVADAFRSRREQFAAELNTQYRETSLVKAHADFREILARPDIDAVFIGAHDNWHTPMAIAAMKAGKDVYCQKPLALDFSLTKLLRQTALESKRVFQFGTQYRSSARYRQMVRLVRNGYIGKLEKMYVWSRGVKWDVANYHVKPYGSTQEIPVPEDLDYRRLDGTFRDGALHCGPLHELGWLPLPRNLAWLHRRLRRARARYGAVGQQVRPHRVQCATRAPDLSRRKASSAPWKRGM